MVRRCFLYWLKPVSVIIWNIFDQWWKSHANWLRKDISCIFHILKTFLQRIFFFNVHARIACNAKAFRNVVLNHSFKFFFLYNPLKHYFTLVFSFWNRTSHLLHARWRNVWVACELPILKRFFFMNLSPLTIRSSLFGWV